MQCLRSLCGSSLPLWSHYVRMLGGSRRWVPTAWLVFCSAAGGFHNSLGLAQFGCTGQWRPCQASHLSQDRLAHVQHREGSFLSLCRPGGDMISLSFLMAYTRLKVWISDHFLYSSVMELSLRILQDLFPWDVPSPYNVKWSSTQIFSLRQLK